MRHFFIAQILAYSQRSIPSIHKCLSHGNAILDSSASSPGALVVGKRYPIRPSPFSIPHFLETTHSQ